MQVAQHVQTPHTPLGAGPEPGPSAADAYVPDKAPRMGTRRALTSAAAEGWR